MSRNNRHNKRHQTVSGQDSQRDTQSASWQSLKNESRQSSQKAVKQSGRQNGNQSCQQPSNSSSPASNVSESNNRDKMITFRTTAENAAAINELAKKAGMTRSRYIERSALGQKLHYRLSKMECEALISINDARADLVNIRSALKGKSYEQKLRYFKDPVFMNMWIMAVNRIIERWDDIEELLSK